MGQLVKRTKLPVKFEVGPIIVELKMDDNKICSISINADSKYKIKFYTPEETLAESKARQLMAKLLSGESD